MINIDSEKYHYMRWSVERMLILFQLTSVQYQLVFISSKLWHGLATTRINFNDGLKSIMFWISTILMRTVILNHNFIINVNSTFNMKNFTHLNHTAVPPLVPVFWRTPLPVVRTRCSDHESARISACRWQRSRWRNVSARLPDGCHSAADWPVAAVVFPASPESCPALTVLEKMII